MPEVSVKDQIKRLIELQKIDIEIYNLRKDLLEKTLEIDRLKEQFEGSKAQLNALEEESKKIQLSRKDLELELQSKEEEISKANTALSQLKTNKEYTAKLSEIEHIKADKSVFEEDIINSYDESDKVNGEIDQEKTNVQEKERHFLSRKKEIEDDVKEMEDRKKVLDSQRKQITPNVDKSCLSRYETLITHKEGLGIVPVIGSSCGGCFMNITQQQINVIKMHEILLECELCSRILYIEDDF